MIRLGLRLTLNGGREALVRLLVTTVAVALGVGMLLITLAGVNGVGSQNARYAWLETGVDGSRQTQSATADPLWWLLSADEFDGDVIGRIDLAATGPHSPVPPGIPRLPGPGQFYASPALSRLLHATPAAELGVRYPGTQIGVIGNGALPAPDSLVVVIGRTVAELSDQPDVRHVTAISTTTPSTCNGPQCLAVGIDAKGIDLVLSVTIAALLFPVFIFIGSATRLSAARREQRFAAMRLVGATPRQVATVSAVESTAAAVAGVVLGFLAYVLLRPALAQIPFTGQRFFINDLSLTTTQVLLVAIGVPVAAALAARLALRRVSTSPLGVTRRSSPPAPRAWRLVPLALGLGELAWFDVNGRPGTTGGQIQAFVSAILLTMAGLVIAGPWLSLVGARLVARRTNRPAVLIAGRRLSDNPQAGFRAISGLVLALFVGSIATGIITTIAAYDGGTLQASAQRTMVMDLGTYASDPTQTTTYAAVPASLVRRLSAVPGVQAVTPLHAPAEVPQVTLCQGRCVENFQDALLVTCAQLADSPTLGHCPPGAATVAVNPSFARFRTLAHSDADTVWPAATLTAAAVDGLPVQNLVLATDGSHSAIEASRTILEQAYPRLNLPATVAENDAQNDQTKLQTAYQQLVTVVILASLVVAGCSLAVSVVTGLTDRQRPFSLLRLAGAPLAMLRRVVLLESAVPLLILAVVSVATGFVAAALFLDSQLHESLQAPGLAYWITVVAGILGSLAVMTSTLPMLERLTGPENARND